MMGSTGKNRFTLTNDGVMLTIAIGDSVFELLFRCLFL